MRHFNTLMESVPKNDALPLAIPLFFKCMDCKVPKLQETAIRQTLYVMNNSDF